MSVEFLALAFLAALNPKLLALDLLLVENRRPRAMFIFLLIGGLVVGITIGLLDVLVFRADAIKTQGQLSAGVDLGLGLLLLAIGGLLATGRVPRRRRPAGPGGEAPPGGSAGRWAAAHRAKGGPPVDAAPHGAGGQPAEAAPHGADGRPVETAPRAEDGQPGGQPEKQDGRLQRLLADPRFGLAMLIGAVVGIPGASYLTALHILVTGKSPTWVQVIAVFVFVLIEFLLIIIPLALLVLRPDDTKAMLKRFQAWLLGHTRQLICVVTLVLGAYLALSGLLRLV